MRISQNRLFPVTGSVFIIAIGNAKSAPRMLMAAIHTMTKGIGSTWLVTIMYAPTLVMSGAVM